MPGSKSDYLEKAVLDFVFNGTPLTLPATVYIALSLSAYSDAATGAVMGEVGAGLGYARAPMPRNLATWPAASGNPAQLKNGVAASFPTATGYWGFITSFYVIDSATNGNALYGSDLIVTKEIQTGDTAVFAANTITITED